VTDRQIRTSRLDLLPLPASVAAVLPQQRAMAARLLGLKLPDQWPQADLYDVLPLQAAADFDDEPFGVWLIVERESGTVVGDIGFMGPPVEDGSVEIGYSVIPGRRAAGMRPKPAARSSGGRSASRTFARCQQLAPATTPRRFACSSASGSRARARRTANSAGSSTLVSDTKTARSV
jgi:hypothetical protein